MTNEVFFMCYQVNVMQVSIAGVDQTPENPVTHLEVMQGCVLKDTIVHKVRLKGQN